MRTSCHRRWLDVLVSHCFLLPLLYRPPASLLFFLLFILSSVCLLHSPHMVCLISFSIFDLKLYMAGKFALNLRLSLWREHLGLGEEEARTIMVYISLPLSPHFLVSSHSFSSKPRLCSRHVILLRIDDVIRTQSNLRALICGGSLHHATTRHFIHKYLAYSKVCFAPFSLSFPFSSLFPLLIPFCRRYSGEDQRHCSPTEAPCHS